MGGNLGGWVSPVFTAYIATRFGWSRALDFAAVTTAYIVVGALLEEHDLIEMFGDDYRHYRQRVSMLVPWRKSA